mmetsp:Transcript_17627/g.50173  ORF Transcript_17627/g.50173 Transcript_17627/m.50173 type:complete len:313 (-) Transcript_17627:159-1097(-)
MSGKTGKAGLTGQLTTLAQKRITRERQKLEQDRSELESCGIYTHWSDEVHKATAMIIGPEGTPYEHGFYFFDIQFPDNYPVQPPHVDFKTGDGRVRFNPNLYVEGKVCLSILGTWSGPSWTSSCTLRTVLVSIQSLLNEHPIQNEPGHEKESGKDDKLYSEIIRYANISVGVVRMLKELPPKFAHFRPQMRRIFLQRAEAYAKTLEVYDAKDGQSARSPIWSFVVQYKPRELRIELEALRAKLEQEEPIDGDAATTNTAASVASVVAASPLATSDAGAPAVALEATASLSSEKRPAKEGDSEGDVKRLHMAS